MPTFVGISTFISRKNSILGLSEPEKCLISLYFYIYGNLKFRDPLSWAWKSFITSGPELVSHLNIDNSEISDTQIWTPMHPLRYTMYFICRVCKSISRKQHDQVTKWTAFTYVGGHIASFNNKHIRSTKDLFWHTDERRGQVHAGNTTTILCCCCCIVVLCPRYTSKVMSGRSVNLTLLFLGRLRPPKRLTSISCSYFRQ